MAKSQQAPVDEAVRAETKKPPRQRSPNFPAHDLETSLSLTKALHDTDKCHSMPAALAHQRWQYRPDSSVATQAEAALKAFGLVAASGEANTRKLNVTSIADRILRNAPDREYLIKEAALRPRVFQELWSKYSDGLPSDDVIRSYLVWDRPEPRFTEDGATEAIKKFRSTIAFAKLVPGDIIQDDGQNGALEHEEAKGELQNHLPSRRELKPRVRQGATTQAREEVFVVPEGGEVVLQFPPHLTPDTFADLKDWMEITLRKISRLVRDNKVDNDQS